MSSTSTFALQLLLLPLLSLTVSTTLFGPTLAQVKLFGATDVEAIPQASFEPPLTSLAVIDAFPAASNWMVMSWQIAVGSTLSETLRVEEQVNESP